MSKNSPRQTVRAFREWQEWAIKNKIIKPPRKKKSNPIYNDEYV